MKEVVRELLFLKEKLFNGIFRDRLGCIDKAIVACNRLTPKKIKEKECSRCALEECDTSCEKNFNRCPNCNEVLDTDSGKEYKHCPECGQSLIW